MDKDKDKNLFKVSLNLNKDKKDKGKVFERDIEVHTMPHKFLSMHPVFKSKDKGKGKTRGPLGIKKNLLIGLIIIVVIGGAMLLAAWLFLRSVDQEQGPATVPINLPSDLTQEPEAEPEPGTRLSETLDEKTLLDINEWLTFNNQDYNYTLKYPKVWEKFVNPANSPTDALETVLFTDKTKAYQIRVSVFENPTGQSLLEWLAAQGIYKDDLESFNLDNHSAYKYEDVYQDSYVIYILYNRKIYTLSFVKTDESLINKVYNQFLINFKFTGQEEEEEEEEERPPEFTPTLDTDKDNLTDQEETLYQTNKNKRDTDGDSYLDGDEVAHLYDPNSPGSARIYESNVVTTHVNSGYNYNIIYPAVWTLKGEQDSVIFQAETGEFVQILVQTNDMGLATIQEWYRSNISLDLTELSQITIADQEALRTPDGMRAYLLFGDYVYSLIYNAGLQQDVSFMTTFDMIIKSFKLMSQ